MNRVVKIILADLAITALSIASTELSRFAINKVWQKIEQRRKKIGFNAAIKKK